MLVLMNIIN